MNWLDFKMKKSKVIVTVRSNALLWWRHIDRRFCVADPLVVLVCLYFTCRRVSGYMSVCNRLADKKAAIGYTYEDSSSGAGGLGVDNIDDDVSSDEDIDLGQSLVIS